MERLEKQVKRPKCIGRRVWGKLLAFMSRRGFLAMACCTVLLSIMCGCSPYTLVNSEVYNDADLSRYSTYRIVTPDMGDLPNGMEMVTYYNIAAAIRREMTMRGFAEQADSPLLVNIAVTTRREIQTEPLMPPSGYWPYNGPFYPHYMWPRYNYGPYWNPAYYSNAKVITGIYKEGVLTVDFVDIQSKLPLYSASVATIINGAGNGYQNLQGISQAVTTLFSKFPVPLLPQYKDSRK